jgi:hypothetical protein
VRSSAALSGVAILALSALPCGCLKSPRRAAPAHDTMPARDVNAVLKDHDKELMAIPGVVGVYVGRLGDRKTTCLKVMVVRKSAELERRLPRSLEGYPVVVEESGVIRPLDGKENPPRPS